MKAIQIQPLSETTATVPVAIYTRVSTLHQVGGRFDSCESQAAICREFIQKRAHEGWHEVAYHTDAAYSGGTMNRPGIQTLMRQIESGTVKVVLIFKLERMLRSTDEWGPFRAFLQRHACKLISTSEDLSEETPSGRLKNNLLMSVAEYERLNTAEKVRAKLTELAKRGFWNCGLVPFGYNYDSASKTLSPHSEEAPVVRRIYEEAADRVSVTEITNRLNADGLRTRVRAVKRRNGERQNIGGTLFKSDSVRLLIRNPIYAGRVRLKCQEYPGLHQALVDAELWRKANVAVLESLQPARCRMQARNKHGHLLKGLVFCAHCNRAMIPDASGNRDRAGQLYRYYTCCHHHKEKAACPVRHVSAPLLELLIVRFIGAIARHPEVVKEASAASGGTNKSAQGELQRQLAEAEVALATIDERLQRLIETIVHGNLATLGEEMQEAAARLKEEKRRKLADRTRLMDELLDCDRGQLDQARLLAAIGRFERLFPKLTETEQRDLVSLCIERIELRARGGASQRPGLRQLSVRLKLRLERLTEGMEERVVVVGRNSKKSPVQQRLLVLEPLVEFRSLGHSPSASVSAPFREEFREERPLPPAVISPEEAGHPIHRAIRWDRQLRVESGLTRSALAAVEGVTPATVTFYLKLLHLVPEIRDFLLELKTPEELRTFSLRRMMTLAEASPEAQRRRFNQLRPRSAAR